MSENKMRCIMSENKQIADRRLDSAGEHELDAVRRATVTPAVDIVENAHAITLWADLPGVSRERLEIKVHDGALSIEGEATLPVSQDLRISHAEVRVPYFSRRFSVSDDFDTAKIDALLKDGVLKLTIPRREEAKPRKVEIRVG
ncbi:heat-shock protein [Caballeronia novacaledonica]|uniref:Heat-shock protein n=1 Tax=Caballeronia novacaledonica TaxID=1544861 RepID=A0ACB5QRE4_9BURK|nr:heat-shock protein [Caballeronia novacaledonica]